ncbi:hypothetical protein [Jeotgalibacillus proteolyticus]|uniref:Lipoprotein n=1 Tax=Jeotgalibacillus proteolyticus TaxID=2082395 RepID=A0A2S5GD64_9BACL|nr:hypothetical protein [Jeotgalibacillus proteolyticus]PPA70929.1 hypothetical protein C4B60_09090 [Jeotgalibacillus proteolyticus]
MGSLKKVAGILFAVVILTACNTNNLNESQEDHPYKQKEGSANILERDREILDNRDDGTYIDADDGGTEANNDPWDGIGGEETDNER